METMTRQEMESAIVRQLAQLFELPDAEPDVEQLNAKLGAELDSMTFIRMVVGMEQRFGIAFKEEEMIMQQFGTVERIRRKVEQALA
ncbi:acyl carrier protein [Cohnella cellulosilytica]|uniref:Acyl carrier protein n=1 Tax=Cohnella cellulosilytica TaxID=986710 RepID=A0ABW2F8U2_9BACL